MRIIALLIITMLSACTTITGRDLPISGPPNISGKKKPSLIVHSPRTKLLMNKSQFAKYLQNLGYFSEIKVMEDYEVIDREMANHYDLELEVDFISGGFFEPYCILTLMIIPCTPPLNWALGVKAGATDNKLIKTYLLKEDATEITWALGFLIPGSRKAKVKQQELKENMLNNLMVKLKDDHFLD